MPLSWQARGQLAFLQSRVGEFKAAQRARKGLKKFYKTTFNDFFELYPNQDSEVYDPPPAKLTKKGKVSKRQVCTGPREVKKFETVELWMRDRERKIRSWLYNHSSKGRCGRARLKLNIGVGSTSKPHVLSEANLYSKKYYPTRVKARVDEELKDVDDPDMRIAITKRCLHESWKSETAAIKTEIRDLRKKMLKERKQEEDLIERIFSGEQNPDDMEPGEYLLAQESIDEIVDEVLDLIATRTGWAASLIMGGPDMSKVNGDITVKTYHVGLPKGKDTFWTATPNYNEEHAKPFRDWCRKFFAESTRLRRAVNIDDKKIKDPDALVEAGRGDGHLVYVLHPDTPEEVAARERRLAAEKSRAGEGTAPDRVADVVINTGDGEDEDGDGEEGEKEGESEKDEEERKDEELGDEEMNWVHDENGIPVPLFVAKDHSTTKAPSDPVNTQEDTPRSTACNTSGAENETPPKPTNPKPGDYPSYPNAEHLHGGASESHLQFQFPTPASQMTNSQGQWGGWGLNDLPVSNALGINWAGGGMGDFYNWGNGAGAGRMGEENGFGASLSTMGGANGFGGGVNGFGAGSGMMESANRFRGVANGFGALSGVMGHATGFGASTGVEHVPAHVTNGRAHVPWAIGPGYQGVVEGLGQGRTMNGLGGVEITGLPGYATPQGGVIGGHGVLDEATAKGMTTSAGHEQESMPKRDASSGTGRDGGNNGQVVEKGGGVGSGTSKESREEIVGGEKQAERGGKEVAGRESKPKGGPGETGQDSLSRGKRSPEGDPPSSRSKRLRHAPAATEFPEWIELAYKHLRLDMSHELWLKVVEDWYSFEKAWASKGMSQSGRMATSKRPVELGAWLPAPRRYDVVPTLPNVHAFADQWSEWWMAVQPECRQRGEGRLPKPLTKNMNIASLKKGGALGLIVVLIGLRWWGTGEGLSDRWEQAVEDVESVFRRFQE